MAGIQKAVARGLARAAAPLLWKVFFLRSPPLAPFSWRGKKAAVALSFDLDLPADYGALPALLDDLRAYGVPGSFGCIGKWVESKPAAHRVMLDGGHEIFNHTYAHPNNEVWGNDRFFNDLTLAEQRAEIEGFERVAKKVLDYEAVGFRTPHFGDLHTPAVYKILEEKGYLYSSSIIATRTREGGRPYRPSPASHTHSDPNPYNVVELPTAACPEHFLASLDGVHCKRQAHPAHASDAAFLAIVQKAVRMAQRHNWCLVFDFGPQDVGGWGAFHEFLEWLKREDVWLCRLREAATWWRDKNPVQRA